MFIDQFIDPVAFLWHGGWAETSVCRITRVVRGQSTRVPWHTPGTPGWVAVFFLFYFIPSFFRPVNMSYRQPQLRWWTQKQRICEAHPVERMGEVDRETRKAKHARTELTQTERERKRRERERGRERDKESEWHRKNEEASDVNSTPARDQGRGDLYEV